MAPTPRSVLWLAVALGGCLTVVVAPDDARPDRRAAPPDGPGPVLDRLALDARDPRDTRGRAVLEDGVAYEITAEGTYSAWAPSFWRRGVCAGAPEPSAGGEGPVGLDAAYAFAVPRGSRACGRPAPERQSGWYFALETRGDYQAGADDAPYNPRHVYRRRVTGRGEPLRAHVYDSAGDYADNYGGLTLTVRRVVGPE